jgi:hypothetical protein
MGRGKKMEIKEGVALKSNLTGKVYRVKSVKGMAAVLEAEDGSSSVITEIGNLKLFYKMTGDGNGSKNPIICGNPPYPPVAQA